MAGITGRSNPVYKTLNKPLTIMGVEPHSHYGFRLLMIGAPVVLVVNNPRIADINVAFVAVEV